MNEHEQFLKDLETDQDTKADILNQPLTPEKAEKADEGEAGETPEPEAEEFDEIDGIKPKTRRERRLIRKIQAERDSAIFLAEKLATREDAKAAVSEESDYIKKVERIYGTDTPEAQIATDLLKQAILGARDDAKAQALAELRAERIRDAEEERESVSELEGFIEDIEDTYEVALSDSQERSFFELMRKMSPKDRDGNVTAYADPHAVWEVFQERTQKRGTATRAKDLSARSMTPSGASAESKLPDDTVARSLREMGII
jgi:hypothetical protein